MEQHQQSDDEVEDLPRPARKTQRRAPTATVTTVEPVASPAADNEVTGKADKKKQKKSCRQAQVEDEAEEVIQQSPPQKKKNKNKQKYTGAWLADLAKDQDRLYQNLKKTKVAHV